LETVLAMNEAMGLEADIYRAVLPSAYIGFESCRPMFRHDDKSETQIKALQLKLRKDDWYLRLG